MNRSQNKVYIVFLTIVFFVFFLLCVVFYRVSLNRSLPKLQNTESNSALRGAIISADGFSIANSQKLYKAMVNTRNIDPNKLELFIKLYSLYSGDEVSKVRQALKKQGVVTLSYQIDSKGAAYLKELARKLYKKKVFIPYEDPKTGIVSTQGLNIIESGEKRNYIANDSLTPFIGYVKKIEKGTITKTKGVKGIEEVYDFLLSSSQDEVIQGTRDLSNTIILSGEAKTNKRIDGYNIVLSVPLHLQRLLENLADESAKNLDAQEVLIGIMEAKSGKILALASNLRYNPQAISKKDYKALNSSASEYAYEAGSVLKPIIFSILLDLGKVNPLERVKTFNGEYKIGSYVIKDSHKNEYLSAEELIIQSSNIGMMQLVEKINANQLYNGLLKFGFARPTGVDLSYENSGNVSRNKLRIRANKAVASYGYGLQVTFMQLLSAYNAINNNGFVLKPKLVSHLQKDGKKYNLKQDSVKSVLSVESAKKMRQILTKVVEHPKGTARSAYIAGLTIGGKTGTAHIAEDGKYSDKRYNSSFFGFVNDDEGNNYTIGVLVREPMKPYPYYFASKSALPVFKSSIQILIENFMLKPNEAYSKINNTGTLETDILD